VLADLAAVSIAVCVAWLVRFGTVSSGALAVDLGVAVALPFGWVLAALAHGAYDRRFLGTGTTEFRRLGRALITVLAAVAFVSFAGDLHVARSFLVVAMPPALLLTVGVRVLARHQLVRRRRAGAAMDSVLLAGCAASLPQLADALRRDPGAGLAVAGVCLPADEAADPHLVSALAELGAPVLGTLDDVREVALSCGARAVAVVAGDMSSGAVRSIAWDIEGVGGELIVSSGLAEVAGQRLQVQSVGGAPLLRVDPPRFSGLSYHLKTVVDRLAAACALILLAPALLGLAAVVRLTSRGPALYRQERIGRNGIPFRMVKFRSMHVGADELVAELIDRNVADGPLFKIRDDPRVTRVGRWMRRFSLDELPQLLNVLTGAMSLVGPRPPLPSEVALYEGDVRRRLLVKPELTGLWQVSGRSDLSWREAVRLDLHYVDNWSLSLDLQLLARTARVVMQAKGAY